MCPDPAIISNSMGPGCWDWRGGAIIRRSRRFAASAGTWIRDTAKLEDDLDATTAVLRLWILLLMALVGTTAWFVLLLLFLLSLVLMIVPWLGKWR